VHLFEDGDSERMRLRRYATIGKGFRQHDTPARTALTDIAPAKRHVAACEENGKPLACERMEGVGDNQEIRKATD